MMYMFQLPKTSNETRIIRTHQILQLKLLAPVINPL
jgi:hypothetical protein